MSDVALQAILRRDRAVVAAAVAGAAMLAWAYLLWLAARMEPGAGEAVGLAGIISWGGLAEAGAPAFGRWSPAVFLFMLGMWAVMMVGMMLPSAAPMLLIHARVARQSLAQGRPFASTAWFAAGYLLAWGGFSICATTAQWGLERALVLTPAMGSASDTFGGAVLVAAGLYQWTRLKEACLSQCQAPLLFIQRHGGLRPERLGATRLGARHGLYCVGCCWALMALVFVGGVMNLLWVAAITVFVLLEKIVPAGRRLSRAAGIGLVSTGLWMLVSH